MTASPRKQNRWEEQSYDRQSGTDQAATSLSRTVQQARPCVSCVYATKTHYGTKNLTQADNGVKTASEGEETSKGRSYLAETKTLRTVRKTKETKTANVITPLHGVKS